MKMSEISIEDCLILCRQALVLQGNEQQICLGKLEQALQSLRFKANPSPSAYLQSRILEQLREPIITMDLAGYLTGWNQGAQTLFAHSSL